MKGVGAGLSMDSSRVREGEPGAVVDKAVEKPGMSTFFTTSVIHKADTQAGQTHLDPPYHPSHRPTTPSSGASQP